MPYDENGQYHFDVSDVSDEDWFQYAKKRWEEHVAIIKKGGVFWSSHDELSTALKDAETYIGWLTQYKIPELEEKIDTLQRYGGENE